MKKIAATLLILFIVLCGSFKMHAQDEIVVTVHTAPPEMPMYEQPPCPTEGYIWTPGYWAYGACQGGYYWVPGVWVAAPQPRYYWTPAWWGFENGYYGYHPGYWGPQIGYYGGINYGYGYGSDGYYGGRWNGNNFEYNTAVCNVNTTVVHNTYVDRTYVNNNESVSRASYNGPGGYTRQPTAGEMEAAKNPAIIRPTAEQQTHQKTASNDVTQYSTPANHGHPATASMDKIDGQKFTEKVSPQPKPATEAPKVENPAVNNHPASTPVTPSKPEQPEQKAIVNDAHPENAVPQQPAQKPVVNVEQHPNNTMPPPSNNANQQQHASPPNSNPQPNRSNPQNHTNPPQQKQNNRQPNNPQKSNNKQKPPPAKNANPGEQNKNQH